ncbi:hypothetical protein KTH35_19550, partial [Acinetobacter baumannii]|nr:hypothetical protein [Acinetobacter baumannii]
MLTHDSRFLRIIDGAEYRHLRVNLYEKAVVAGGTTYGTVRLAPGPADVEICPLTGREYDPLRHALHYAVRPSGEVVRAAGFPDGYDHEYTAIVDGRTVKARGPSGVPTFSVHRVALVDNEAARRAYGFVRLDPELYPDGPVWAPRDKTVEEVIDGRARRVLLTDCVLWCEQDSAGTW